MLRHVSTLLLFVSLAPVIRADAPAAMSPIRLSPDGRHFVRADSGKPFAPWGFNYLGAFGAIIEESWATDWPSLEKDFRQMRALGANVVRVHLQFGSYIKTPTE